MNTLPTTSIAKQAYSEAPNVRGFSTRDSRNTSKAWMKQAAESRQGKSTSIALRALQQQLANLRRRPVGMAPEVQSIRPFQFYSIQPTASYAIVNPGQYYTEGDTLVLQGGELAAGSSPTTFTVYAVSGLPTGLIQSIQVTTQGNYTTPPVYPASVTGGSGTGLTLMQVSSTDQWRTVSMRNGVIGLRSRFFPLPAAGVSGFGQIRGLANVSLSVGNYQWLWMVDVDGLQSFENPDDSAVYEYNPIVLETADTPVLISGVEEVGGDLISFSQIILNVPPDGLTHQASFWIEIVDSPTSRVQYAHANLWGKIYLDDGTDQAFPTSTDNSHNANIIPVAIVAVSHTPDSNGNQVFIQQFLDGNLVNIFDAYFNNTDNGLSGGYGIANGTKMCIRGDWTIDNLSGQYFYPGDIVRDIGGVDSLVANAPYLCLTYLEPGTPPIAPNVDTTHWLPLVS